MSASKIPLILEHNGDIPLVEIRHIFRSGASLEPAELAGIGRIALRLLRRGTAKMGRKELDAAIDGIAALMSAQATSDFFALHLRVLRKYLDQVVELFQQVVAEPALDVDELERLKRETLAEIVTARDDDRHLASRAMRMLVYGDHPYGVSARGSLDTVEAITVDGVKQFLAEHLVAQNILVGAAGDITEPEIEEILGRTVGQLPDRPAPPLDIAEPARTTGVRVMLVDKPARTQTQIFLGHLGPSTLDPMDMALRVALTAFGGTFTSRLMREVRVKRGWSYGAYASLGRARFPEILSLYAFPSVGDAVPCLQLLMDLFGELKREGPPAEEIAFARDFLARSLALQKDTAPARLTLRLRQELLQLPDDYYDTYAERVRKITTAMATEAVATHVDDQNLCIAMTCTADEVRDDLRKVLGEDAVIETIPWDSPQL